jgi:hypothetical protein
MTLTKQRSDRLTEIRVEDLAGRLPTNCSRCGGFLITTFCITPDQGTAEFQIPVWKCLQCGDVFDAMILKNRRHSQHHHSNN